MYVANGDVTAFAINSGTGALNPVSGSPFARGSATAIAVDPTGKFLFSTSAGTSVITYSIEPTTGALIAIPNGVVAAGISPSSIAVSN
jgi:6-phosphogluconolactonase (cycloisomerase 2 family)